LREEGTDRCPGHSLYHVTLGRAFALGQIRGRKESRADPEAALLGSGSRAETLLHRGRTEPEAKTTETLSAPPSRMGVPWQEVLLSGEGETSLGVCRRKEA
jgi:hypothetical protein